MCNNKLNWHRDKAQEVDEVQKWCFTQSNFPASGSCIAELYQNNKLYANFRCSGSGEHLFDSIKQLIRTWKLSSKSKLELKDG